MFLLVCVFGGLGAVTRFVANTSVQRWWNRAFPLATLVINILAAFCAGVAAATYASGGTAQSTYLLFVTGFLGGFSTFSTAINEMLSLARSKKFTLAAGYFAATIVIPFLCAAIGWYLASPGR
ncbi:fluoride efflux transporter FluC [Bifidobacterium panos]|uniref:Fluoride-specific ion channel FluC n=1 Tax=Bifidobacterium panos TaxID=2675321 RepID=A0ABX1SVG3_9BIFI|nr:CrcB family protein [Bifidobacterium sp. DSM 109963]NMN01819.1 camphor resistance protein CrcB [Bifidobacterium sp. DSM 109963]